tara:strand:- start:6845 stop:7888 length:1044 start_codon:yes stop_codon:yes gene_type:complete
MKPMKNVKLVDDWVGDDFPCYSIAEIGGSFQSFEEAKRLIDSAVELNVNAIKFQTLEAETITTKNNFFDMKATGKISQYEIFKRFELSKTLQQQVVDYAKDCGKVIFTAPSHIEDLRTIDELNVPIIKIGSDLACHIPLLKQVASTGKPIILSTGMCNLEEVRDSVEAINEFSENQLILMHCVSNYPSDLNELNLRVIPNMKSEFNIPVGFSDHTPGLLSTITSVTLGANIIERHFKDLRNTPSPDDIHALTKDEFSELLSSVKMIKKTLGDGEKQPTNAEKKNLTTNRVSIVTLCEISEGSIISEKMIDVRRPGDGIPPKYYDEIIGRKAKTNIAKETTLKWDYLV